MKKITNRENCLKSNRIKKYSPLRGVSWEKGKFIAQIHINGRNVRLGSFDTDLEANKAYEAKLKKIKIC